MRFLLAFLLSGFLMAQSETTLHFDRPFHAAGEVAHFTAFLPAPAPPVVRVAVFKPDGSVLDYFFLDSDAAGTITGYYRWPYELTTGTYRLQLAALSTGEETVDFGVFPHAVYNDGDRNKEAVTDGRPASTPAGDLQVSVNNGTVSVAGAPAGSYSLSVYNAEVAGGQTTVSRATAESAPAYLDTLFYPGRITSPGTSDPVQVNLLPFFDVPTLLTYFTKSNAAGDYVLTLASFQGSKQVQARSVTDEPLAADLSFPALPAITTAPTLTQTVKNYLDLSNRRRKIYQLYGTVETELSAEARAQPRREMVPNKDFNVQDYKAFPDMFTFFKEVAGELRYRNRKAGYMARLYNAPNQRFFMDTPLFIVDGKLTRDADYIAQIKPANVEYLAFYYDNQELRQLFPALGNNGVVVIDLLRNDPDFPAADQANILSVKGLQPAVNVTEREVAGVPELSPLLLWESGSVSDGRLSFPLPETDDRGNYRVNVVIRAADGSLRTGSTEFTLATEN